MKSVLVVGSGGREHALAWKLEQSPEVEQIYVAPGNDGMPKHWKRIAFANFRELAQKAKAARIALTVVGPDNALAEGIVDVFTEAGLLVFGPTQAASCIEASKAFAKSVMQAAGVPTARFEIVKSIAEARQVFEQRPWGSGWVVKADGLALGKGVQVCTTAEEALSAVDRLLGVSGSLVLEERLTGEEVSWMAFCDGERAVLLEPARDYKRVSDGDHGPNTGGMGALSPVPGFHQKWSERLEKEVFLPVLKEMKRRGAPFRGVLYAGLMVDLAQEKFWVLEFNARFGDPETQVLMARMGEDLLPWCEGVAKGDLSALGSKIRFDTQSAVVVVAAAEGYPDHPQKGAVLKTSQKWEEKSAQGLWFFAGVQKSAELPDQLQVSGGRVVGIMGKGKNLEVARLQAYQEIEAVDFKGMHYRRDIAANSSTASRI